jgi:hypothetical protein
LTGPVLSEPALPAPVLIHRVFDKPEAVFDLVRRHGPYWNQSRYQPAVRRAAAAATPAGHPYAMDGGAPPLFRGNWADDSITVEGAAPLLANPVLHDAARSLFGGAACEPTFLYVNITAPMPGIDAGHVDVPSFRGLDRRAVPGWLLLAMQRSGQRRASHRDDLTAERALSIMAEALGERGQWDGRPVDLDDPRWTEAVMAAYPRLSPPDSDR